MRPWTVVSLSSATLLMLAGCAGGQSDTATDTDPEVPATASAEIPAATATLNNVEGSQLGTVTFSESEAGTEVRIDVDGLESGFYGFHLHSVGLCEADSAAPDAPETTGAFLSAGGHLGVGDAEHGAHAGDLPSLYITETGQGTLQMITDGFTTEELLGGDGSAVMIHSGPDNFGNIPERYAPEGPDQSTLNTGDAGARQACGVVE